MIVQVKRLSQGAGLQQAPEQTEQKVNGSKRKCCSSTVFSLPLSITWQYKHCFLNFLLFIKVQHLIARWCRLMRVAYLDTFFFPLPRMLQQQ